MEQLPVFLNLKGRKVVLTGSGEAADAKRRLIESAGGTIAAEGAKLAFVAADPPEADAARLDAAGLLVNAVDRPDLCDFTVPAIVDRAPVTVAVGTGGASATLSKALRERLEALLPANLGDLARAIDAAKPTVAAALPAAADRRRFWDALLAPGGPLDPLADHADPAATIIAALGGQSSATPSLTVISVHDPDDLTLRELRALSQADTLFHAPGAPAQILDRARRDAVRSACAHPPLALPPGRSVFVSA